MESIMESAELASLAVYGPPPISTDHTTEDYLRFLTEFDRRRAAAHALKELREVRRTSDFSVELAFTSVRACSEFMPRANGRMFPEKLSEKALSDLATIDRLSANPKILSDRMYGKWFMDNRAALLGSEVTL